MADPRVVVVGSSNTDMVVKSVRIPRPGETVTGGQFVMAPGGKGANQAVAAARLGAAVTFVANVGRDVFGEQAIQGYRKEGVDVSFVGRDEEHATGVALILVDGQGENLISVASGANHALSVNDVDRAAERIRRANVLMLQLETSLDVVRQAAQIASAAGVPVILDPAPAPAGMLDPDLLRHVTYLTPNESEASRLTGVPVAGEESAREAAGVLLESGVRHVIVTLGPEGALVAGDDGSAFVAPIPVVAVDSTAAGDAFNGGLATGLARGDTLPDAVRLATIAGALAVTRMGAQPSLPSAGDVAQFRPGIS